MNSEHEPTIDRNDEETMERELPAEEEHEVERELRNEERIDTEDARY